MQLRTIHPEDKGGGFHPPAGLLCRSRSVSQAGDSAQSPASGFTVPAGSLGADPLWASGEHRAGSDGSVGLQEEPLLQLWEAELAPVVEGGGAEKI